MKTVRIGAGLGFYGDAWWPVAASIERGDVQYIASDHLAELTLAILQKDRARDPASGYTKDLVPMLAQLWPLSRKANGGKGVRFLLNAGGLNPHGARDALAEVFRKKGWHAKIAVVTGDDVLDRLDDLQQAGQALAHLDTGQPLEAVRERMVFANAYLGAAPLVRALEQGADIVLAGRVADAALFLAPLVHEFGWTLEAHSPEEWNRLAQGLAVGHLLECSGQGSGGNFGGLDWKNIPDLGHIGYPIAEVDESGTATITKAPGTGGRISFDTVRQQLLYEVQDPRRYYSPDVVLDMGTIRLDDLGDDRVRVSGATGRPRPAELKIVGGYQDGWMGQATFGYSWPQAYQKAERTAAIVTGLLQEQGMQYDEMRVEYLGYDSILGRLADPSQRDALNEIYLRMAIRAQDKRVADGFGRLFPWLALSGPPFVGGRYAMQPASELLGIWPALAERGLIEERVAVDVMEV
ncbi:acyclic terpene utilization AtuA family protein [Noviherbaspirillum sp.]|uniref:acyclic terpene utilization AtuA family protein n=1 Tax=Noviherbaspirillum sp. TaxID=1926288 RepID=UPI002D60D8E8|nr:acyclic terpene utilization AtuA family protein [Noviherbaspirillum sp.]HZW19710.1 acyclic terpene utilization AtuA family protein [Noviherbaspirillum sp.]